MNLGLYFGSYCKSYLVFLLPVFVLTGEKLELNNLTLFKKDCWDWCRQNVLQLIYMLKVLITDVASSAETSPKTFKGELRGAFYFSIPPFDLKNAGQLYSAVCDQNKC